MELNIHSEASDLSATNEISRVRGNIYLGNAKNIQIQIYTTDKYSPFMELKNVML